jgi:lipopolysaccharide transport system ATP-binding protein
VINQDNIIVFQTNDWVPSPRSPGHYRSIVWIPGNLMAEGLFYVTVGIATPSPTIKRVRETDVIMFNVVDTQDGRTERTLWGGDIPGIIRPVFMWETVGPLVASDNRVEVDKGLFHKR